MKFLGLIIIALLLAAAWSNIQKNKAPDPVEAMRVVGAEFPLNGTYNVVQTDSLVNPFVGTLDFWLGMTEKRAVFHWSGARWRFVELINTGRGNNFLDTASEVADRIIAKVGDRGFFDKYGWPASSTEEVREREVARQAKTFAGAPKFDQYGKPINRALPQDTVATPVPAPRYRNPLNR